MSEKRAFLHKLYPEVKILLVQLVRKDLTHSQRETDQKRMRKGTDFRFGKNATFPAIFKLNLYIYIYL